VTETARIEQLRREGAEFRQLDQEHRQLEGDLTRLFSQGCLTVDEEWQKKRIQKIKLSKKDRMSAILIEHKQRFGQERG